MAELMNVPYHRIASVLLREVAERKTGIDQTSFMRAAEAVEQLCRENESLAKDIVRHQRTTASAVADKAELQALIEQLKSQLKKARAAIRKKRAGT